MRIAVVGLGLIGGSLLRALAADGHAVFGYDADPATRAMARTAAAQAPMEARWQISGALADAVAGADLVVVAIPLTAVAAVLEDLAGRGYPGLVTDVTSVKEPVRELVAQRAHRFGRLAGFVGGHPMAGRETAGFAAADPALFRDCAWVLCLEPGETDLGDWLTLARLVTSLGARVVPDHGRGARPGGRRDLARAAPAGRRAGRDRGRRPARADAGRRLVPRRYPGGGQPAGADRGDVRRQRRRGPGRARRGPDRAG